VIAYFSILAIISIRTLYGSEPIVRIRGKYSLHTMNQKAVGVRTLTGKKREGELLNKINKCDK
jgi:hypothetical protein